MSAKEMFEALGYEYYCCKRANDNGTINCNKEEIDAGGYKHWYTITFWFNNHTVSCDSDYEGMCVDMPTFKAIHQQLLELGWL